MVNLKRALLGLSTILVLLLSLGIATATFSQGTTVVEVDTTTLEDAALGVEKVTGDHGTTVSGTFTLNNLLSAPITITTLGITSSADLNGTTTSDTIPNSGITFPSNPTIAASGSTQISYSVVIPTQTSPDTYTGEITVTGDDGSSSQETMTFDFEVTVNTDNTVSIVEGSLSQSVVLDDTATYNFDVTNEGNVQQTVSFTFDTFKLNWKTSETVDPSTVTGTTLIAPGATNSYSFTVDTDAVNDKYGIYSSVLTVTSGSETDTLPITLISERATDDDIAKIDNFNDIEDNIGEDDVWRPGDIVEIKDVEFLNQASDYALQDAEVEATLYKISSGKKYDDIKINLDEIDEDDSVEETIELQIPYDAPQGNYIVQLEMSSENADVSSEKHTTTVYTDIIDVERDSRHVVVEDVSILQEENLFCGGTANVDVKITNIGTKDLDNDDNLRLVVKVDAFDFEEYENIEELDEDDSLTFSYAIDIPGDKTKGDYFASAELTYDKDEDDEGTSMSFTITLDDCGSPTISPSGDAEAATLFGDDSGAGTSGQAIKYTMTVTNSGSDIADYTLDVVGANDWATVTIEPAGSLRLAPGQTATAFVYLTPHSNAAGTNTATVNVQSAGQNVATKTVTAAVTPGSATVTSFASSTLKNLDSGSAVLYVSVMMNLVLLMVMIGTIYTLKNPELLKRDKKKKKKGERK